MKYSRDDSAGVLTSFYDVEVEATLKQLIKAFGKFLKGDGYKTHHEWRFKGPRGDVTLYDYKYNGEYENYWHVGGLNKIACIEFKRWVNTKLSKE